MPHDFEPAADFKSDQVTLKLRPPSPKKEQASETFNAFSTSERPLGRGGEQRGFAKKDLADYEKELKAQNRELVGPARERLKGIEGELTVQKSELEEQRTNLASKVEQAGELSEAEQQELNEQLAELDRKITKLNDQIGCVTSAIRNKADNLGSFAAVLPDHANHPAIAPLIANQAQIFGLRKAIGAAQPLFKADRTGAESDGIILAGSNLISRAVASSSVDKVLGTNVLAEEKMGVAENGTVFGVSIGVDGAACVSDSDDDKACFLEANYASHEVQKGLYDLEAVDYISGQIDRHAGNIFVNPSNGSVKGIDNDLAFPEMSRDQMLAKEKQSQMIGKPVHNLPMFMHTDTAEKIESLSPDVLREELQKVKYPGNDAGGELGDEAIEGAVTRLKELQDHVQVLRSQGRVVETFTQDTYATAVNAQINQYNEAYPDKQLHDALAGKVESKDFGGDLDSVPKTSYIGTIEIARIQNDRAIAKKEGQRLPAKEVAPSIARDPTYSAYQEQVQQRAAEYRAGVPVNDAKLGELQAKLDRYEQRLAKLEDPSLKDRLRALRFGGVERAKKAINDKRLEVKQAIKAERQTAEDQIARLVELDKPQLWQNAQLQVQLQQLNQGSPVQNAQQPALERRNSIRDVIAQPREQQEKKAAIEIEKDPSELSVAERRALHEQKAEGQKVDPKKQGNPIRSQVKVQGSSDHNASHSTKLP